MRNAIGMIGVLWLCAAVLEVHAAGAAAARRLAEGSMLVTGDVVVGAGGTVRGWRIDKRELLPPVVAALIDDAAATWRFEVKAADEAPREATVPMRLRVVASPVRDSGQFAVSITSAYFGDEAIPPDATSGDHRLRPVAMARPIYPESAVAMGGSGTVYLVLQVDRNGAVSDAFAEQVNLKVVGSPRQMNALRDGFARSALRAARRWTFAPPTSGADADELHWYVRVPVEYGFDDAKPVAYGQWDIHVPGPRHAVPWRALESLDGMRIPSDALIAGEIYQAGTGRVLLTPLGGG